MTDGDKRDWLVPPSKQDSDLLKRRAESLARSSRYYEEDEEGASMVLILCVGNERYGVEMPYIYEVLPHRELTPVPGVPAMVKGVFNFRGEIVPLYDLLSVVTDKPGEQEAGAVVVFGHERVEFAVEVDRIEPPVSVNMARLKDSISRPGDRGYTFVRGFTESGIVVLNMAALLEDESLIVDSDTGN